MTVSSERRQRWIHTSPALQAKLWNKLQNRIFEDQISKSDLTLTEALSYLDVELYYDKMQMVRPSTVEGVTNSLREDGILVIQDNGLFGITNLGAVLYAKRMKIKLYDIIWIAIDAMR